MNLNYNLPYPFITISKDNQKIVKIEKNPSSKKYIYVRVCDVLQIDEIIENIDENSITAKIDFLFLGKVKSLIAKREDYMNRQNILKLQKQGLDVTNSNADDVIKHLRNEEELAKRVYQHSRIGFGIYNSTQIFKHYQCIGSNLTSTYCGKYAIKPKGSRDTWLNMFENEVQGHTPLELICVLSLSASVLGYIGEDIGLDNIICHLTGNSTTGKSTAMKLAISMFGYPDVKENGLFTSYNSTANALIKALAGIKGVPVAFDEISMSSSRNFSNLVYKLANGVDKTRLNKNSELRDKDTWLTTIFSNGEESIIQSSSNTGIYNRVFEFDGIIWTKNAKNAEEITKIILCNYGHIGYEFVAFIMKYGTKRINVLYEKNKVHIKQKFINDNITDSFIDRRINRYAVFLTTATLFQKLFKLTLNTEEMIVILEKIEQESIQKRNFDKTVIEYLSNVISININKFDITSKPVTEEGRISAKGEYWGKITKIASGLEVEIVPLVFDKLTADGGFKSSSVVLKELKDKGYLDHETDKNYRKRNNNLNVVSKVYVISIKNVDEDSSLDEINKLIDSVSDFQTRALLEKEKERQKEEIK